MTNLDKILKIALIITLSAYQMKHIAAVEGWETAIIIEVAIIIMSILDKKKPLALLLVLSSMFVLSFHLDGKFDLSIGGFELTIKAMTEILLSFSVPYFTIQLSRQKSETDLGTTVPEFKKTSETKIVPIKQAIPRQKPTSILSQKVWDLKQDGLSIRKTAETVGLSKGQVERMLKKMC